MTWERKLRVTLTFDVSVPDDRVLVTKIEKVLRNVILKQGLDNTPGLSIIFDDGTPIYVYYHYANRYFENGERVSVEGNDEGGMRAPELAP